MQCHNSSAEMVSELFQQMTKRHMTFYPIQLGVAPPPPRPTPIVFMPPITFYVSLYRLHDNLPNAILPNTNLPNAL